MFSLRRVSNAAAFWRRRKRFEEARAYLAAIVESSDDAIIAKNLEGVIQSCNAAAERIFGYSAAELIGRPITILIPPERLAEETEILERLRRGERVDHFETVRLAKGGRAIDISLTISPVRDASGRIIGASKIARDISDRKRAEATLRRAQQVARFLANAGLALTDMSEPRTILQKAAGVAVPFLADWCTVDVLRADGSLERLAVVHGEPRKAELARQVANRWLPEPGDQMGPGWVARTGKSELMEDVGDGFPVPWVREGEHLRVLQELGFASYICLPVSWGRQLRAVVTFVVGQPDRRYQSIDLRVAEDLVQRASVAIENAVLYRTALEADRRKDEFLAVLSHELRTPLNAIVGWTELLRDGAADIDTVRKAVGVIHRNAQVQTQLISDILDISRIAAGKMRLDVRPVELPVVIEAALETLRPAADARRVRLETVLDPRAGLISGDASRLQQIVWNLVSNAIKFAPEGLGRVELRLEASDSHLRLTVEDNGPGIDPAFLPHVFERFSQAESAENRYRGLGLGLAIVRQLVELHGGSVRVQNREGASGAIFSVQLPRRNAGAAVAWPDDERQTLDERSIWLRGPSLTGLRVLVVDDEGDSREVLKAVLERCGAKVAVAASAREALAMVASDKPDVMLTDVEMPEQSGYDLLRQLRSLPAEQGGQTPAVALTAYASPHDRVKLLRSGFQLHLPKPVEATELATVVASLTKKAPETGF